MKTGDGPDQQHAGALEPAPVAVEQVRGPVQGDRRLAGARAALDQGHAAGRGADRLVLLALDGGDDVAHPVALGPGQRGQQGAVADHRDRGRASPSAASTSSRSSSTSSTFGPLHRITRRRTTSIGSSARGLVERRRRPGARQSITSGS